MSLTEEELERRRGVVGASEAALLFGIPSYGGRTLSDLWFEKKYGTVGQSKGNASTSLGTKLEPIVLAAAEERMGVSIVDRQKWVRLGSNAATLDGRVEGGGAVVEAKTSGIIGPTHLDEWGEEWSDNFPDMYLIQLQAQLLVTGAETGYLAALIGGRGFVMYESLPHPALMKAIQLKSDEFIASLSHETPPEEPPQLETLKRIRRQPEKVLPRSDAIEELYQQLEEASALAKASNDDKENIQRRLLAMLGDAEAAECRGGRITYYEQSRKESYVAASTFRVLRFAKGK